MAGYFPFSFSFLFSFLSPFSYPFPWFLYPLASMERLKTRFSPFPFSLVPPFSFPSFPWFSFSLQFPFSTFSCFHFPVCWFLFFNFLCLDFLSLPLPFLPSFGFSSSFHISLVPFQFLSHGIFLPFPFPVTSPFHFPSFGFG